MHKDKNPNKGDWNKLICLMKYLNRTRKLKLCSSFYNFNCIKHWVNVAFAVHPDFRSHTGSITTLGKGSIAAMSRKQKINTRKHYGGTTSRSE